MRLPFIPREEKFFQLFVEDAHNVLAGARLLEEFFRSYDQRERIASQLRDLEHEGDQISHDIGHRLARTFVTSDRLKTVRWGVARSIVVAWVLTLPASALAAALTYLALRPILG